MTASDKASSRDQSVLATVDTRALALAFCAWPLPASVCADPCAAMPGYPNRSGTNLITVAEAKAMFDHLVEGGFLQAAPSKVGDEDARRATLAMEITGGKLVMSIGVEALAMAIEGGPMFDEGTIVTDHDVFAAEVLAQLQDEDEVGTNLIHRAFDSAFEAVAESGAEGVTFPEESL